MHLVKRYKHKLSITLSKNQINIQSTIDIYKMLCTESHNNDPKTIEGALMSILSEDKT